MSDDLEYWHNKGEQDYAEGNGRNPPHNQFVLNGLDPSITGEDAIAENRAYKQGYKNAEDQAS
jgi:hypothetical protein